jgi:hypothetical protein
MWSLGSFPLEPYSHISKNREILILHFHLGRLSPDKFTWDVEHRRLFTYSLFSTTKDKPLVVELSQGTMLRVEGNPVDTIRAVSETGWKATYDFNFNDLMRLAGFQEDHEKGYIGGGTWEDAYWRTVCGDQLELDEKDQSSSRITRRCGLDDKQTYFLWLDWKHNRRISENSECVRSVQDMRDSALSAMYGRRFFVTQRGYLGLGPKKSAVGDEAHAINGSTVPFVLRRVESGATAEQTQEGSTSEFPRFRLVGGCYVHGIMDGEACDESTGVKASSLLLC